MAYHLLPTDPGLTEVLRRIAAEQLTAAIADTSRPFDEADVAIHDIRKHCKKLRGLVRLMRPGFDGYATENAAARDIARRSSSLRDAGVTLKTHDALVARYGAQAAEPVRSALAGPKEQPLDKRATLDAMARQRDGFQAMLTRSAQWRVIGKPRKVLEKGLATTFLRGATDLAQARDTGAHDAFHDWRKRVKYHWYHSRILQPLWPGPIRAHRDEVKRLSEYLGDYQDLSVYLDRLAALDLPDSAGDARKHMKKLSEKRRRKLSARALDLGARVYADPPEALPHQWASYWFLWDSAR